MLKISFVIKNKINKPTLGKITVRLRARLLRILSKYDSISSFTKAGRPALMDSNGFYKSFLIRLLHIIVEIV